MRRPSTARSRGWSRAWAPYNKGKAPVWPLGLGGRVLLGLGDLLAHLLHVERLDLLDEVVERRRRERSGLGVEQHLVAEHHQRRDAADLEHRRELLLRL